MKPVGPHAWVLSVMFMGAAPFWRHPGPPAGLWLRPSPMVMRAAPSIPFEGGRSLGAPLLVIAVISGYPPSLPVPPVFKKSQTRPTWVLSGWSVGPQAEGS